MSRTPASRDHRLSTSRNSLAQLLLILTPQGLWVGSDGKRTAGSHLQLGGSPRIVSEHSLAGVAGLGLSGQGKPPESFGDTTPVDLRHRAQLALCGNASRKLVYLYLGPAEILEVFWFLSVWTWHLCCSW